MTKKEIIGVIEGIATNLNNGDYGVSEELTENLILAKIEVKDEDFNEEDYGGVIIEKDTDGDIFVFIDDFSVYPTKYTVEDFAEKFAE